MDEDELDTLGINSVIEEDDICLAMIKLLTEHTDKTIVLYFDELESPYRMHGAEAEQKFLEILKRLYNEVKNLVIIIAVPKRNLATYIRNRRHAITVKDGARTRTSELDDG